MGDAGEVGGERAERAFGELDVADGLGGCVDLFGEAVGAEADGGAAADDFLANALIHPGGVGVWGVGDVSVARARHGDYLSKSAVLEARKK